MALPNDIVDLKLLKHCQKALPTCEIYYTKWDEVEFLTITYSKKASKVISPND